MAAADQGIAAAGRFNQDVRPEDSGPDMNRSYLGDVDADFVLADPGTFMPDDRPVRHLDDGGEKKITARQPARFKGF